jgi:hypothetical protein
MRQPYDLTITMSFPAGNPRPRLVGSTTLKPWGEGWLPAEPFDICGVNNNDCMMQLAGRIQLIHEQATARYGDKS